MNSDEDTQTTRTVDAFGGSVTNYDRLMTEFGIKPIEEIIHKLPKEKQHYYMNRDILFGHSALEPVIEAMNKNKPFAIMTGIKPSSPEYHIGNLVTCNEVIYFQQQGGKVYFCIADIESYADGRLSLEQAEKNAIENVADLIALGLDLDNAYVYRQSQQKDVMQLGYLLSSHATYNMMKAIYGEHRIGVYNAAFVQVAAASDAAAEDLCALKGEGASRFWLKTFGASIRGYVADGSFRYRPDGFGAVPLNISYDFMVSSMSPSVLKLGPVNAPCMGRFAERTPVGVKVMILRIEESWFSLNFPSPSGSRNSTITLGFMWITPSVTCRIPEAPPRSAAMPKSRSSIFKSTPNSALLTRTNISWARLRPRPVSKLFISRPKDMSKRTVSATLPVIWDSGVSPRAAKSLPKSISNSELR